MNDEIARLTRAFVDGRAAAELDLQFDDFVAATYAVDAEYSVAYGGVVEVTARGRQEILETHYGRDMSLGWDGWTWPSRGTYVGEGRRAVVHWVNLAPGRRPDGSPYETPGVSFLVFDAAGKVAAQSDVMDLAAQLHMCGELDAAGLLSPALRDSWVSPMKQLIVSAFS